MALRLIRVFAALLALLTAAPAAALSAAPAYTAPNIQNCARASLSAAPTDAQGIGSESPCRRPGSVLSPPGVAVGCCVAAREAPAIVRGGETAATRYGREIHKTFDYGPGFRREFTLPSGRRADAVNLRARKVVELKPNNPRAIAQGRRQLDAYARELEELYPGAPFTRRLETYDRP